MIKLEITANNVEELNTQLQSLVKAVEQQDESLPRTVEERPPYAKFKTVEMPKPKPEAKEKVVDKKSDPKPDESEEVNVSAEDLRAKTLELKNQKGAPAVRAILKEFDTAKLSELSKDSYADFYTALEDALNE